MIVAFKDCLLFKLHVTDHRLAGHRSRQPLAKTRYSVGLHPYGVTHLQQILPRN
jgi:hypothetical protein